MHGLVSSLIDRFGKLKLARKVQVMGFILVLAYIFMIGSFSVGLLSIGTAVEDSINTVEFNTDLQMLLRQMDLFRSTQLELLRLAKEMLLARDERHEAPESAKTRTARAVESAALAQAVTARLTKPMAMLFPGKPELIPIGPIVGQNKNFLQSLNKELPGAIESRKQIIINFNDQEAKWATLLAAYQEELAGITRRFDLAGSSRKVNLLTQIQQKTAETLLASAKLTKGVDLAYIDQKNITEIDTYLSSIHSDLLALQQVIPPEEVSLFRRYQAVIDNIAKTVVQAQLPSLHAHINQLGEADLKLWTLDYQLQGSSDLILGQLGAWERLITASIGRSTSDMTKRQAVLLDRVGVILSGNALIALMASFVVVILFIFFSRSILIPVNQATKFVNEIEAGNLSIRMSPRGNDEISALGRSLDNMAQRVLMVNTGLEQLVTERTNELEKRLHDLREAQARLLKSERLASMTPLLFGVAHELNTPLGTCITAASYASQLIQDLPEAMETPIRKQLGEALDLVNRGLGRSTDLIRNFKGLAILQNQDLARSTILGPLCREVIDGLYTLAAKFNANIDLRGDLKLEACIVASPMRVALEHAIGNAIVHGSNPESSTVLVEISHEDTESAIIRISDSGKGMADGDLAKAFEPFFTTARNHGMTGLGLFLIHNIVHEQLNGSVTLANKPDGGMCLTFVLPRHPFN